MNSSLKSQSARNQSAFSLIELMVVVGIIGILITLSTGALSDAGSSRLSTGGNLVVDITNLARQNSMCKHVMTALVMAKSVTATDLNNDPNYRAFALVEKAPEDMAWKPVTGWTLLPTGIAADPGKSAPFVSQTPVFSPAPDHLPSLRGASPVVGDCAYQVFLPDGRLSVNGITSTLQLPALHLVEKVKGTDSKNYYKVILNLLTGTPHIERP